jgi:diaminopimelate epimerase
MNDIEFYKMHGCGNDFILIDNRKGLVAEKDMGRIVQRICRRRESVGADGVIFVVNSKKCDFGWRFFNADGGEAEMCGNGSRCVARFAYLKKIAGPKMTFETLAGPIAAEVKDRTVKVKMPLPRGLQQNLAFALEAGWHWADFLNTGVPHTVIQVDDLAHCEVKEKGRAIRQHTLFAPQGTNANFIKLIKPDCIEIRTYERGVEDETLACGTGSMAAALLCAERGLVKSPVTVKTRSGENLLFYFQKDRNGFSEVWMEGPTAISFEGRLHPEAF